MNSWLNYLYKFDAWNQILKSESEDNAWHVRTEYADSIVHCCLLMPSRLRDTLTMASTNSFHQIRLKYDTTYKDHLHDEPEHPAEQIKCKGRKCKEHRLFKVLNYWNNSQNFIRSIKEINTKTYIKKTKDYRNLASHFISPHFVFGDTNQVTRTVQQATTMVETKPNEFQIEKIKDKMCVSYAVGGSAPLDLEQVHQLNYEQYKLAKSCYDNYVKLLKETLVAS